MRWRFGVAALTLAPLAMGGPSVAADAAHGKELYAACAACHGDAQHKPTIGPSLAGVIGRKAGSLDDFRYSPAMQRSTIVWSDDTLRQYLLNPQATVKGNRMPYAGIGSDADAADVVGYLHSIK